jgi:hypothetical protein
MISVGEWFVFVCMTSFWVSLILLLMYLLHAIGKYTHYAVLRIRDVLSRIRISDPSSYVKRG